MFYYRVENKIHNSCTKINENKMKQKIKYQLANNCKLEETNVVFNYM